MRSRASRWTPIAALAISIALAAGCGSGRTVLVAEDSPSRVGPNVSGPAYTLIDDEWTRTDGRIEYPEGWYVVPPRFVRPGEVGGAAP